MTAKTTHYFEKIHGKTVCFIGYGIAHQKLALFYHEKGALVKICDQNETLPEKESLLEKGIILHLGKDYLSHIDAEIIFRTPGLPFETSELTEARRRGRNVTSEMETFFELCPAKIYGITGSDGKTTSTTITAELLRRAEKTVHIGGNIGVPLLPEIENINEDDIVVVELSSFQLESFRQSPNAALMTNIYHNHLDRHKDMAEYTGAKKNIYLHQHGGTHCVLNADNLVTNACSDEIRDEVRFFSTKKKISHGAYLREDNMLMMVQNGIETPIIHKNEIRIPGMHNVENFLAVIALTWEDVSPQIVADVAKSFVGVEHRIEFVREKDGVRWFNDVIATTPSRTKSALLAFPEKIRLIAGGSDKNLDYHEISALITEHAKALYLSGPTAKKIATAVLAEPNYNPDTLPIYHVTSLEEAVILANTHAESGDVVVLSPASASFDAYKKFTYKGAHFKELVQNL